MPNYHAHKKILKKCCLWHSFKLKIASDIGIAMLFAFIFSSCDSETMDPMEVRPSNEIISTTDQNSESITAIILDNNYFEFYEALNYVNDELYTSLVEDFNTGTAQHTVFIPSNEAFYKLYDCLGMKTQDITELSNPGLVRDILQYHVVKGRYDLQSITNNNEDQSLESFYGASFMVQSDGQLKGLANSSRIVINEANQIANNGIVHVINEVMLPIEAPCSLPNND